MTCGGRAAVEDVGETFVRAGLFEPVTHVAGDRECGLIVLGCLVEVAGVGGHGREPVERARLAPADAELAVYLNRQSMAVVGIGEPALSPVYLTEVVEDIGFAAGSAELAEQFSCAGEIVERLGVSARFLV